jgi:hypothetical protein
VRTNPGIVEENVDTPERAVGGLDHPLGRAALSEIREQHFQALAPNSRHTLAVWSSLPRVASATSRSEVLPRAKRFAI